MKPLRFHCWSCNALIDDRERVGVRDHCASCGAELHTCRQCVHHAPQLSKGCTEDQAEGERHADVGNHCSYFELQTHPAGAGGGAAASGKARQALEDLFD